MSVQADNVVTQRLDDQIDWYDRKSRYNQKVFKILKVAVILAAAGVPLCAGLGAPSLVTGGLGAVIMVLESLQQLNQYQHNWITYRSTCELLKHEKYLYLSSAGPYCNAENPIALLAERVESLVSQEHAKWVSAQKDASRCIVPRKE
ncbi:MAG: DUF4231 domain-containing protein [Thermodesulfobacteriota bacterium]